MGASKNARTRQNDGDLVPGLYDFVIGEALEARLRSAPEEFATEQASIEPAEAPRRLAARFSELLEHALQVLHEKKMPAKEQVQVCNRLILALAAQMDGHGLRHEVDENDLLRPELLLEVTRRNSIAGNTRTTRPSLPLAQTHLLVNARGEHSIGSELRREIPSADSVDLLCSFLLWPGYQQLKIQLMELLRRKNSRLRIITTVYMGVTDARVLDELHEAGAEIRVSYDTRRTRLHAKAWLLNRGTGFTTAYIGSSNLSAPALTDGLEWNVRIARDSPHVLEKFEAAFDGYWNDPSFEPYDRAVDGARIREALAAAGARGKGTEVLFDIRPYPYQQAILEKLETERFEFGRMRNLVVAATGTGKTIIAALDFKSLVARFRTSNGRLPSLLFVAHRREILEQARASFRSVLGDSNFGEFLLGGDRPTNQHAVFASIQSLAQLSTAAVPANAWDVVIVDEFHHAAAKTYRQWLDHLSPWILLGLTATPDRADGEDIRRWFGGQTSTDLRLWDAIDQGLLVPFQYFGLKDALDTSSYWTRGKLDLAKLDGVLSAHDVRARQVLDAVREHVVDPSQMRALGFCVGRQHAHFMAKYFNEHGLLAETALGDDGLERQDRIEQLRQGKLQALFTVDALSEGVDIRELDTVLMLRPTESPTVFLQQLGRGLRLHDGKRCLTVLDLVSVPEREFRMDLPLRALTGGTRAQVRAEVEAGFPSLPPGCSIQLTDDAREIVLANLKSQLSSRENVLVAELRRLGADTSLAALIESTGFTLDEIYKNGRSLTSLRRKAGFPMDPVAPIEALWSKGAARFSTLDDHVIVHAFRDALIGAAPLLPLLMPALVQLFGGDAYLSPGEWLKEMKAAQPVAREAIELLDLMWTRGSYSSVEWTKGAARLRVHCHYTRDFIQAALAPDLAKPHVGTREGVWSAKGVDADALLVTTNKSEKGYSPSTMYKDYAISRDLFHWQSQSTSTVKGKRGQRHVDHAALGVTPLLFVRSDRENEVGTAPYLFLGPASCFEHHGERPINITWKLEYPMPAEAFEKFRVAR